MNVADRLIVPDAEVRVGDTIWPSGHPHVVVAIEPYEHPTVSGSIALAFCADEFAISLWEDSATVVTRPEVAA